MTKAHEIIIRMPVPIFTRLSEEIVCYRHYGVEHFCEIAMSALCV
jgi:hypothetical protein